MPWIEKALRPTGSFWSGGAVISEDLHIIQGRESVINGPPEATFPPVNFHDSWNKTDNLWTPRTNAVDARNAPVVAALGTKLYVGGGALSNGTPQQLFRELNTLTGTWAGKAFIPVAKSRAMGASIPSVGKVYVGGGQGSSGITKSFYEWNQATNTWTAKADFPANRYDHGMCSMGDKIYVMGGASTFGGGALSTLWEWDRLTDIWTVKSSMPEGRFCFQPVAIGTKIYVVGGIKLVPGTGNIPCNTLFEWDQVTDSWSVINDPLPVNKAGYVAGNVSGSLVISSGSKVGIVNSGSYPGFSNPGEMSRETYLWVPAVGGPGIRKRQRDDIARITGYPRNKPTSRQSSSRYGYRNNYL